MRKIRRLPIGVTATVAALLMMGCSNTSTTPVSGKADPLKVTNGPFGVTEASGSPVSGGSLTFGYGGGIASFDPASQQYAGTSGGDEARAVYGTLTEYDTKAGKYAPSMAESISANDDFTEWTVVLRDGVKFTDGTPYDADAVLFNFDRMAKSGAGFSGLWTSVVKKAVAKDAKTVVITLKQKWADFPYLLSQAPGMIASPKAVKDEGESYQREPVGAGPFMLDKWTPGQNLVLKANPDYWDGKPYLDSLTFQTITTGDQALKDALQARGIQGSLISTPAIVKDYIQPASGYSGYVRMTNTGSVLLINNGTPSRPDTPGKDINVREAIASAINPDVINQRAFGGNGFPGTGVFSAESQWANDKPTFTYDVEAAKKHLAAAKGFDGTIELLYPAAQAEAALTIEAQLDAVGFKVDAKPVQSITDLINAVLIKRDYDLAMYGWPVPDEPGELYTSYLERFGRKGNQLGYYNETVAKSLSDFAAADDTAEKAAQMATIQAQWTETVPAVPYNTTAQMVVWDKNVHDIEVSSRLTLDFSKAWISK
ncbi:ABC transporter substrate-binding protein [Microbispora hainanensis]|uniref:ABC transporter substrate-binding protein n=1 Tax=Microbispora hainanensis TaxID=568844 RepID=UPI0033D08312